MPDEDRSDTDYQARDADGDANMTEEYDSEVEVKQPTIRGKRGS